MARPAIRTIRSPMDELVLCRAGSNPYCLDVDHAIGFCQVRSTSTGTAHRLGHERPDVKSKPGAIGRIYYAFTQEFAPVVHGSRGFRVRQSTGGSAGSSSRSVDDSSTEAERLSG